MYLVGDIGGTKTRLAIFAKKDPLKCLHEKSYPSKEYKGLSSIVKEFLKEFSFEGKKACFGVAGPVQNNKVQTTNLPWTVDASFMQKELNLSKVYLINDLEANAWGIDCLQPNEIETIHTGEKQEANAALISAGTGLGQAGLYWNKKIHLPFACEGGHTDFSAQSDFEIELFYYLKKKYGHVSWERVVSGPGIYEIYQFLIQKKKEKPSLALNEKEDLSKQISEAGIQKKDPVCMKALHIFISFYGAEAGNVALKFLSLGGVYIGGGIAPKVLDLLKADSLEYAPSFKERFMDKGRMKKMLEKIPIYVVLNSKCALLGAFQFVHLKDTSNQI